MRDYEKDENIIMRVLGGLCAFWHFGKRAVSQ